MLIEDKTLQHGVWRSRNGHVYFRADSVPTHAALLAAIRTQLTRHLQSAQRHMQRVEREMQAVRNDLELAIEDPEAPIGHDLLGLRVWSNDPSKSSLTSALRALEEETFAVRRYQDAVQRTVRLSDFQVD